MIRSSIQYPGPLGLDATVVSGTSISDAAIKAPLGPEFQEIAEWTNNASLDLATFTPTARTRVGPRGVLIYREDLSEADQDKADRYLGADIIYYTLDSDGANILDSDNAVIYEES